MSQTIAAEMLGTTRQVIGAFEATKKEAREPRAGELMRLASLYRISTDAILTLDLQKCRKPINPPVSVNRKDRDAADDALDDWELVEGQGAGEWLRAERELDAPPRSATTVASALSPLRDILGLGVEPPFDIVGGLIRAGFIVEFTAMKSLAGALLVAHDARRPVIVVNSDQPDDRLRWTAAHEAAHWILRHHPGKNHADSFGGARDPQEWAADNVAGELLAPAALVREYFHARDLQEQLADAVYRLSRRFGLSYAAMAVRLGTLRLLSSDVVTRLRTERPTEIEERLRLRVGTGFDVRSIIPTAVASLQQRRALPDRWEREFADPVGQRHLRRLQREALGIYLERVPEARRVTGVTQVFEETARWTAAQYGLGRTTSLDDGNH